MMTQREEEKYLEGLIGAIVKVAKETPNGCGYVTAEGNSLCSYSIVGEPNCIVGRAMREYDPQLYQFASQKETNTTPFNSVWIYYRSDKLRMNDYPTCFAKDSINKISSIQTRQDMGNDWETSVREVLPDAFGKRKEVLNLDKIGIDYHEC